MVRKERTLEDPSCFKFGGTACDCWLADSGKRSGLLETITAELVAEGKGEGLQGQALNDFVESRVFMRMAGYCQGMPSD